MADAVLLELTRRLEATVPEAISMWRHGVDEILVVLLDSPDGSGTPAPLDVAELVERIQQDAGAPRALDDSDRRITVSVSVGVARVPVDGDSSEEPLSSRMLRSVELALAEAKQHPDRSAVHLHHDSAVPVSGRTSWVSCARPSSDVSWSPTSNPRSGCRT